MGRGGAKEKPEMLPQLKPKNAGEVGEGELQAPPGPTLGKRMREVTAEKRQERVCDKNASLLRHIDGDSQDPAHWKN